MRGGEKKTTTETSLLCGNDLSAENQKTFMHISVANVFFFIPYYVWSAEIFFHSVKLQLTPEYGATFSYLTMRRCTLQLCAPILLLFGAITIATSSHCIDTISEII